MSAGGKRFRPMLALLAAQLGDAEAPEVIRAAVVCELTHLATLYHDDVMDEAAVRRGAPSANSRWTNSIAILTGDLLFARASDLLADLGPDAVRIQAQTFERLVTGQMRETVGAQPGEDPIDHYLDVLADKTGSLVATSARFGAGFAGVDAAAGRGAHRVRRGGRASPSSSPTTCSTSSARTARPGSRPAPTCARAIATLPVLFALAGDDPAEARLRELVAAPDHRRRRARRGPRAAARVRARWRGPTRCCASTPTAPGRRLTGVPAGDVRDALSALCDYVVTRTS